MPGSRNCRYSLGRAGQRAAEQVREHQRQHDRERGHVEQLLGHVLDLQHRPPAERQRRRPGRSAAAGVRRGDQHRAERLGDGVSAVGRSVVLVAVAHAGIRPRRCSAGLAGEGQEHLVEAGLAEREVVDGDAGARPARPAPCGLLGGARRRRPRPARSAPPGRTRAATVASERAAEHPLGRARAAPASRSRTCRVPAPTDALSSPGVPSAMTRPWSMTAMRSASWSASSRYCVVSSTVVPSATSARTMSHTWLRLRGSRPVVGSSRNSRSGVYDDAGGDVEAAAHAAGVVLHLPVGGVGQAERVEQLARPASRAAARAWPSRRPSSTRFSVPVRSSSTEANWPVRLTRPRTASASRDDVVAEHAARCRRRAAAGWRACGWRWSCRRRWGRARRRPCRRGTARSTPSTARLSPNVLTRPAVSMAGALMVFPSATHAGIVPHRCDIFVEGEGVDRERRNGKCGQGNRTVAGTVAAPSERMTAEAAVQD